MENTMLINAEQLSFCRIDANYLNALRAAELKQRGFSRVPNPLNPDSSPRYFCGIALQIHGMNYFVPLSGKKQQQSDNCLIQSESGAVIGSLRFNFMFPVPDGSGLVTRYPIDSISDRNYRQTAKRQLSFCRENVDTIQALAQRTYDRVVEGQDPYLAQNSCDFRLLEERCRDLALSIETSGRGDAFDVHESNLPQVASSKPEIGAPGFYYINKDYVEMLRAAETAKRGFSRVPKLDYSEDRKPKFFCGVMFRTNDMNYFVPVSSYNHQHTDNLVMGDSADNPLGSLRFTYMIPVPDIPGIITERPIASEPDRAYRSLLSQQYRYCIKNQEKIRYIAERTYRRILLGKDSLLVENSCDFRLLEECCRGYMQSREAPSRSAMVKPSVSKDHPLSFKSATSSPAEHRHRRSDRPHLNIPLTIPELAVKPDRPEHRAPAEPAEQVPQPSKQPAAMRMDDWLDSIKELRAADGPAASTRDRSKSHHREPPR